MNRNIPKFYVCDEMQKLRDGLDERNIPWNDLTDKDDLWICRTHFWIKGDRWSVIHGFGSYGGFNSFEKDKQLLECKYGGNEPIGWLTADEVLVCTWYGHIYIDTLYSDDQGCYFEDAGDMEGVIAWMPLPEPYKEAKDEH